MASFLRLAARQGCRILSNNAARQQPLVRFAQPACLISTSKKNKDAVTLDEKMQAPATTDENTIPVEHRDENWMPYGWNKLDPVDDEFAMHFSWFFVWTVVSIGGIFVGAYYPDLKKLKWTQREAFLELARREQLGLPRVDGNLVDPARMSLPSDEELGDTDIVI